MEYVQCPNKGRKHARAHPVLLEVNVSIVKICSAKMAAFVEKIKRENRDANAQKISKGCVVRIVRAKDFAAAMDSVH